MSSPFTLKSEYGGSMFIDRLNEALKINKMTGNALCKKMNISNSLYTGWKTNKPQADRLTQIANILNVSVDWLLEREGADTPDEEKLLYDYKDADARGKETIINIAELEARRSRSERDEITRQQENEGKKLNFTEFTAKHKADQSEQEEDNELKPFA